MMSGDPRLSNTDSSRRDTARQAPPSRNLAEWTTLIVSSLVVALLIGAVLVEHFVFDEPPGVQLEATIAVKDARRVGDLFSVPFTARNTGSDGAENVTIAFTVRDGDQTLEESTIVIDFLPNSDSAQGELVTRYDPSTHGIEARITTYETP